MKRVLFWKNRKKREDGNVVDMMAGVIMMVCLFAIILAMLAYSSLVEKRLAINNTIRNYLYIAEQQGGLTETNKDDLESFLSTNYSCSNIEVKINGATNWLTPGTASNQVAYGGNIELSVEMDFPNPIYQVVGLTPQQIADGGGNNYWFRVNMPSLIHYGKILTSTSRW